MKIRTYTDRAREVPDGFICDGCGAVRKKGVGNGKWCAAFCRDLVVNANGRIVKCFECTMACRSMLIVEGIGGKYETERH